MTTLSDITPAGLLKHLTCDCKDDGNQFQVTERIDVIKQYLQASAYTLQAEEPLFLLYAKQPLVPGESVLLISSHIDCVYKTCFCTEEAENYIGTFDNSFTNAALIHAMLTDTLPAGTVIAFTGDEEHDSAGAVSVNLHLTRQQTPIRFALVLDVTNAGWEDHHLLALENDLGIDLQTAHRIIETMKPYEGRYTYLHDAEPDETWDYNEYGIPCVTLSAPVGGNMHGEEGVQIQKQTFPLYCEALSSLAYSLATPDTKKQKDE